jgi:hypothetical protein
MTSRIHHTGILPMNSLQKHSMFQMLRVIVARLWQRHPPGSAPYDDPFVGVREPRRRRPGGRSSAVAISEPEPEQDVRLIGRLRTR